ncbi:hypothetical protein ACEQ8H_000350 [Pleosporales sp. CAS-2024a]
MRATSALLLFARASPALAAFEQFYFAGNAQGNATGPHRCGDMLYDCIAPSMCSQDTLTQKWYCCEPGNQDGPCWTGATSCGGGQGTPSGQQIGCTNLNVNYCCAQAEGCTQLAKQFNICWSKQNNTIRYLNSTRLNQTYSSLSSANPKTTAYTVASAQLFALTSTTPGASSATPPTTTSASASASTTSSSTPSTFALSSQSSSGLSGGAIGGIVGGIVGGLALLGAIGFALWRRQRSARHAPKPTDASAHEPYQGYGYQPGYQPAPQQAMHEAHSPYSPPPPQPPRSDKYAHHAAAPVEIAATHGPAEMDAGYQSQSRT